MDQYSEEHGAHQQYGERSYPDTLRTVDVDADKCEVLEANLNAVNDSNKTIAQWVCDCGLDQFRVFARNLSTVAQCVECNREKEIHEG